MTVPLDAHQSWITLSDSVLRPLSCGLRCVGNLSPFPKAYLETCGVVVDEEPSRLIGAVASVRSGDAQLRLSRQGIDSADNYNVDYWPFSNVWL